MSGSALGSQTGLPARIWKATLEDALNAIKASRAAALAKCVKIIWRSPHTDQDKKLASTILNHGGWIRYPVFHRLMRKHWPHGESHVANQIVFDVQGYTCFILNGQYWIKVSSLISGKRISIPLGKFNHPITGAIRVRIREDGEVDILYTVDEAVACVNRPCGTREMGIDKGYSEVFTDSDGQRHGEGLGELLAQESDHLKEAYAARQKLEAIAQEASTSGKQAKAERIRKNNLGRKKLSARKRRHRQKIRTKIFTAAHAILDKAGTVVVEDLTKVIIGHDRGRNLNRRLAGWVKGLIQEAIESTSRRRGASVNVVNAAYPSQWLPDCLAFGRRIGEFIYCPLGRGGFVADHIAAVNILHRKNDTGISRYLPYRQVRKVLEERSRQAERPCVTSGQCAVHFGHA
jgi:IS605 OrfB family transposase